MALNITFDGFVYLNDGTTLSDASVKYQAYFYKVNAGSSSSQWNDVRTVEGVATGQGYYSLNLGDGLFLGQQGTASSGDIVVIVFWKPTSTARTAGCGPLTEWGLFRVVLGTGPGMVSLDTYTNDAQVKTNICPNLSWSLPLSGNVGQTIVATNSSTDTHQWNFDGAASAGSVTMWQRNSYYAPGIYTVNDVNNTDYDWDDGNFNLNLPGAANGSHAWAIPGNYTVEIVIEDDCGCTVTGTKSIQILNNAPTCGIKCNEATGQNITTPDTVVTFEYDGTDTNNTITSIDWKINDSGSYGNTDTTISGATVSGVISHTNGIGTDWCGHAATAGAFTNPGAHLIESWIHWNDGFNDHTLYCSETFTQLKFSGPTVDFDQDPAQATVGSNVKFTNTSSSTSRVGLGLPDCDEYDWTWDDDGTVNYELDKPYVFELERTPTTVDCDVTLCAWWSDGWSTLSGCVSKAVVFATNVTVTPEDCYYNLNVTGTSSDGSYNGYHWEVYKYTTFSGTEVECDTYSDSPELLWTSPTGMDQQEKTVCFTAVGCYKLMGYVHGTGTTTSGYKNLYIEEVCEPGTTVSGVEIVAICPPEFYAYEIGKKDMEGKEIDPSMKSRYDDLRTSMKGRYFEDGVVPAAQGRETKPSMKSASRRKVCPFCEENL